MRLFAPSVLANESLGAREEQPQLFVATAYTEQRNQPCGLSYISFTITAVYAEMRCIVVAGSQSVRDMTAMFSQVKISGQSCCIFDELWFLPDCRGSSSEILNKADASVVMNDCNQCDIVSPEVQLNFASLKYIQYMSVCVYTGTSQTLQPRNTWISHSYDCVDV